MKYLFVIILFCSSLYAQDEPKVCISQAAANKCATIAAELIEARNVIAEYQKKDALTAAERQASQVLIKGLNDLIDVKTRVELEKDKIIEMYAKVVTMYQGIVADLEKRLMKPKSGFQKFMDALKAVGYILAGVSLGRGI